MNGEIGLAVAFDAESSRVRGFIDRLLEEAGRPTLVGEIAWARGRDLAWQA
jgi:hypothetical protein